MASSLLTWVDSSDNALLVQHFDVSTPLKKHFDWHTSIS